MKKEKDLKNLTEENVDALKKGLPNLEKHLENVSPRLKIIFEVNE